MLHTEKLFYLLCSVMFTAFLGGCAAPVQQTQNVALSQSIDLHSAIMRNDVQAVTKLLDSGVSVETWHNQYGSPLIHATTLMHKQIIRLLVSRNANVNARSQYGWTPLGGAALNHSEEVALYLVGSGADIDAAIAGLEQRAKDVSLRSRRMAATSAQQPNEFTHAIAFLQTIKQDQANKRLEQEVNTFLAEGDLQGLKNFADKNPNAVYFIKDPALRLALTGPEGLKVGDVVRLAEKGKSDVLIISLINRVKTPYKEFTLDEIDVLTAMGLNDTIIAAMIDITTELLKDEARKKEQEYFLKEQAKIAKESQKTQVIYQSAPQPKQKDVVDVITEEAARQGMKMLLDKMF